MMNHFAFRTFTFFIVISQICKLMVAFALASPVPAEARQISTRLSYSSVSKLPEKQEQSDALYMRSLESKVTKEIQKLMANDGGVNETFGRVGALAISNSRILVGAPYHDAYTYSGAAYLFLQTSSNNTSSTEYFSQMAILTADDADIYDCFGTSVDMDGDWMVVGAYGKNYDTGAAYIFHTLTGNMTDSYSMTQMANLTANNGVDGDWFGLSVAIQANLVLVGANKFDRENGSVYGFANLDQNGSNWQQVFQLQYDDEVSKAHFGVSLALEGDLAVIGTFSADAAYVFAQVNNNITSWTQVAKLVPGQDDETNGTFGYSVAIAGNKIVVSAHKDNNGKGEDAGAVFVFHRTNSTSYSWTQESKLIAKDGDAYHNFGTAVTMSKDSTTIVVGADIGSVYIFSDSSLQGKWSQIGKFVASDGAPDDFLGRSVALENNLLVVGAPNDDVNNETDVGSVYVVELTLPPPNKKNPSETMIPKNEQPSESQDSKSLSQGAIIALGAFGGFVVIAIIGALLIQKRWTVQKQAKEQLNAALNSINASPPIFAEAVTGELATAEMVVYPPQLPSRLDTTIEAHIAFVDDALPIVEEIPMTPDYSSSNEYSPAFKDQVTSGYSSSNEYSPGFKDQVRSVATPTATGTNTKKSDDSKKQQDV